MQNFQEEGVPASEQTGNVGDSSSTPGEMRNNNSRTAEPPRVENRLADLGDVTGLPASEVIEALAGQAFKHYLTDYKVEVVKGRDKLQPESVNGMRQLGTMSKAVTYDTHTTVTLPGCGRLREANTGNGECSIFNHTWYNPHHVNSVDGKYRAKATLAIEAENTTFDTGFYRMQRRDAENLQGYLVTQLDKGDSTYLSFYQEALGHMLFQKVRSRNLLDDRYAAGLTKDYVVGDIAAGEGAVERDVRIDRTVDPIMVEEHPPFGILWPDPAVVGPPRDVATVRFIPSDDIMESVVTNVLANETDIFVSRSKSPQTLAEDILAAFSGTRPEFGVYSTEVTIVLATMSKRDWMSIFKSWGLRPDRIGSLTDLAHWLIAKGYNCIRSSFVTSRADYLRCRDYMALSNTIIHVGDERKRVHDTDEEPTVSLPYASWKARLCLVYNILDFQGESWTSIREWEVMRKTALIRGIDIGQGIDYALQTTIGSLRNIPTIGRLRPVEVAVQVALAHSTNICYSEEMQLLCFKYDWDTGLEIDVAENNTTEIIGSAIDINLHAPADPDVCWWIETRMTWEACQTPDLDSVVSTELKQSGRDGVCRYGNGVILSCKSSSEKIDRLVSILAHGDEVDYNIQTVAGLQTKRVRWTNSVLPSHYVHWSHPIDKIMQGRMSSNNFTAMEVRNDDVYVAMGSSNVVGDFDGMDVFTGFSGF